MPSSVGLRWLEVVRFHCSHKYRHHLSAVVELPSSKHHRESTIAENAIAEKPAKMEVSLLV